MQRLSYRREPRASNLTKRGEDYSWLARVVVTVVVLSTMGCAGGARTADQPPPSSVEVQGHRGARGHLPENTIPSFLLAVDQGADTIELDVVISADGKVVVSHEPWFSSAICSKPDGGSIAGSEERSLNIYRMTYAEVARHDCGLRGNPRFPTQEPMAVVKPLLRDAIAAIERHSADAGREPVSYNVETKSMEEGDGVYHPAPAVFARLVYDVLSESEVLDRTTIQSFDPRTLEAAHEIDAEVSLALLVDNDFGLEKNLARLTFAPDIYSPNHRLVNAELTRSAHALGLKVIPWTINDEDRMKELIALGVDGIITDYPDMGRRVVDAAR